MTKTTKKQTDEVEFDVMVADESHEKYVDTILDTIEIAARKRGSGIARRTHEYVAQKMREGKVIIALAGKDFARRDAVDIRRNGHSIARRRFEHSQMPRKFNGRLAGRYRVGQNVDIPVVAVVSFHDFQLPDIAREGALRHLETFVAQGSL